MLRAALLGVLELLEDEHAGALAHDEAVAIDVERPRLAFSRLLVARRQRAHRVEAADAERRDRRLGAAGDHRVGVAALDEPHRLADRVRARRARRHVRQVRPLAARSGSTPGPAPC